MIDHDYISLFIFAFECFGLSALLAIACYIFAPATDDLEKSSAYECGFAPFEDARIKFDIHFYLVAILFIIFDVEIIFLFPWCSITNDMSGLSFWSVIIFLIVLAIGFIYEWTKNALTWK